LVVISLVELRASPFNPHTDNRRVMPAKRGDKAFSGEWEKISAYAFEITEDMTMEFHGKSCNIMDSEENLVEQLGEEHGQVSREVLAGYRCYVMRACVKFEKKSK